ncbi:T9SS-dependent M36 family metallopeptidase [Flavobacterium amniphilum]|uniref:T9SS-dependent M36 family metallopeptidase n=1 Tax=Flavobacterium amniphilum TaxID=1834035 RepID=UPI002029FF06|nr:T9SS-dependent M36 family metallopeptidase [Flavobacterium amniphilum]MCL9804878.1 T9SS-dependent M36 family metallopeptidase [Flavobacterium amniphilum]
MKRKLLVTLFCAFAGFSSVHSQSKNERIQQYFNQNAPKLQLTEQDSKDWFLENITSSETTGIENCYVKQSHQGIEIQQSYLYFWIKNGEIINTPEGFLNNIAAKINATRPTLSVTDGFSKALTSLGESTFTSAVIENTSNKYKLSNGNLTEDPVNAKLIYFLTKDNTLRLAWSYEFYSQNTDHLWNVQIDAQTGSILEKRDLVLRCGTAGHDHSKHKKHAETDSSFLNKFYKQESPSAFLTPGTTNYRVIPWNYESPNHSARQLITNPEATTILAPSTNAASPNGWHNTSTTVGGTTPAALFNYSRGNNVWASSDFMDTDSASPTTYANASAGTYPSLTFDYPYGGTGISPKTYINAAITNVFYMNNIMHDLWYQYGFTEPNRNFQNSNYGRGGAATADYVFAEAQDGSFLATPTYNNANFATPVDGSRPRMQMYIWNSGKKFSNLSVTSGTLTGTSYQIIENAFNEGHAHLPIAPAALTNSLVLFDDGTPDNSDACTAAVNGAALSGKIAVVRRGSCTFAIKAKAAQNAGAVAVLVVNNAAGTVSMAGDDPTITIPALSMTQADGEALITSMSSGTVNVSLSSPDSYAYADGDFDNGIIAHEYGHGISTRLVGGGAGLNSAEQPGEGWSDWFWLMMQIKPGDTRNDARGIATFSINEPTTGEGIREFRYSTNLAVNPHTYGDTNDQWYNDPSDGLDKINVHGVGSIWCAMLWDLAWDYIDKYGYSSNIYNGTAGNNKVMRLVLDALKLTPANPSFIQCRDAIITADQNTTGGQDFCLIWATFARRGLGTAASAGANTNSTPNIQDQTESFLTPAPGPNCTLAVNDFDKNNILIYPNPSNGLVNIKINSFAGLTNLQIVDLNGRIVYTKDKVDFSTEKTFNLSHLQAGVYIIKLNGDTLNHTQKIILD